MKPKTIRIDSQEKIAQIHTIKTWMDYDMVIAFLDSLGYSTASKEDLVAYHTQYPDDFLGNSVTALSASNNELSPTYDNRWVKGGKAEMKEWLTKQGFLSGCSFLGIKK